MTRNVMYLKNHDVTFKQINGNYKDLFAVLEVQKGRAKKAKENKSSAGDSSGEP